MAKQFDPNNAVPVEDANDNFDPSNAVEVDDTFDPNNAVEVPQPKERSFGEKIQSVFDAIRDYGTPDEVKPQVKPKELTQEEFELAKRSSGRFTVEPVTTTAEYDPTKRPTEVQPYKRMHPEKIQTTPQTSITDQSPEIVQAQQRIQKFLDVADKIERLPTHVGTAVIEGAKAGYKILQEAKQMPESNLSDTATKNIHALLGITELAFAGAGLTPPMAGFNVVMGAGKDFSPLPDWQTRAIEKGIFKPVSTIVNPKTQLGKDVAGIADIITTLGGMALLHKFVGEAIATKIKNKEKLTPQERTTVQKTLKDKNFIAELEKRFEERPETQPSQPIPEIVSAPEQPKIPILPSAKQPLESVMVDAQGNPIPTQRSVLAEQARAPLRPVEAGQIPVELGNIVVPEPAKVEPKISAEPQTTVDALVEKIKNDPKPTFSKEEMDFYANNVDAVESSLARLRGEEPLPATQAEKVAPATPEVAKTPIPETITTAKEPLPEFLGKGDTDAAQKFGEGNPEKIPDLEARVQESLAKAEELRNAGDSYGEAQYVQRANLDKEAISRAKNPTGKSAREKAIEEAEQVLDRQRAKEQTIPEQVQKPAEEPIQGKVIASFETSAKGSIRAKLEKLDNAGIPYIIKEDGGYTYIIEKRSETPSVQEKRTTPKSEQGKAGKVLSLVGLAGSSLPNSLLPFDEETNKKLKLLFSMAGFAGAFAMIRGLSPKGTDFLKSVEDYAKRKGIGVNSALREALKSGEAKSLGIADKTKFDAVLGGGKLDAIERKLATIEKEIPAEKSVEIAKNIEEPTQKSVEQSKLKKRLSDLWMKTRETFEDNQVRVKKMLHESDADITSDIDPYLRRELYVGRVKDKSEKIFDRVRDIDKERLNIAKQFNIPDEKIIADINEYLRSKHTPERNAVHGERASGITNEQAIQNIQKIESLPYGSEVKRVAKQIQELSARGLEIARDGQLITEEQYQTLKTQYPNHVPLNRILEDEMDIAEFLSGKGFAVKSSGMIRAKGSSLPVSDILGNVTNNIQKFTIRAEKNLVDLSVLEFAREHAKEGMFTEIKPKPIGKGFDGRIIYKQMNDPNVLQLREKGKPVYLKIKDDGIAQAIRGLNDQQLPTFLKFIRVFTGISRSLATWLNPEFPLSNKLRDIQELVTTSAAQKELGFSGAGGVLMKDPTSMKMVSDFYRGVDNEGTRLYKQLKADGGTTGGLSISSRAQIDTKIEDIMKLNRSKKRQAAHAAIKTIDILNTIFEDSSRLSVYREALKKGLSRSRAAFLAKNATINFDRHGTASPIVNAFYMFANASVQGSAKMLRAMKNPKVAAATVTAVGGAVAVANSWNDNIDSDWREKVSDYDRQSNLVIALSKDGGGIKYITIPVSWGLKPIKVAADAVYDLAAGRGQTASKTAEQLITAVVEAYNPAGGTDVTSAITPTILDVPVNLARGRSWTGSLIKPLSYGNKPEHLRYFKDFGKNPVEKVAKAATNQLANIGIEISPADAVYAFNQYIGGAGRFTSKIASTVSSVGRGETPVVRDIPFVSRFYKSIDEQQVRSRMRRIAKMQKNLEPSSGFVEEGSILEQPIEEGNVIEQPVTQ